MVTACFGRLVINSKEQRKIMPFIVRKQYIISNLNKQCKYMLENKDYFQAFIEDDKNFDDYMAGMSKDSTWGGNLELYSTSMKFNVNLYIHIYNRPLYIIKNFDDPYKNIHLSYHNGDHYNSVRLYEDPSLPGELPLLIPDFIITGMNTTNDANLLQDEDNIELIQSENIDVNYQNGEIAYEPYLNEKEIKEQEEIYKNIQDELVKKLSVQEEMVNTVLPTKEPSKNDLNTEKIIQKQDIDINELTPEDYIAFNQYKIKDYKQNDQKKKYNKMVLTEEGLLKSVTSQHKRCHCGYSNKKYKNCHFLSDLTCDYDKPNNTVYLDLKIFCMRFPTSGDHEQLLLNIDLVNDSNSKLNTSEQVLTEVKKSDTNASETTKPAKVYTNIYI